MLLVRIYSDRRLCRTRAVQELALQPQPRYSVGCRLPKEGTQTVNLPHDIDGRECACTRCLMAVRSAVDDAARAVLIANLNAVLAIRQAQMLGESYARRVSAGLDPLRLARVLP